MGEAVSAPRVTARTRETFKIQCCEFRIPRTSRQAEESRRLWREPAGDEGPPAQGFRVCMDAFTCWCSRWDWVPVPDLQFWPCHRHGMAVRNPVTEGHPVP